MNYFVFPSEVSSRFYQKYLMRKNQLTVLERQQFLVWDQFLQKLRKAPLGLSPVSSLHQNLFVEFELEKNAQKPFFQWIIPPEAAAESCSYRGVLRRILSELSIFAVIKENFNLLPEIQTDLTRVLEDYRQFLTQNQLYDPHLEKIQPLEESDTYRIFYPEILNDFQFYKDHFGDNVSYEWVPQNEKIEKLKVFPTEVTEIRWVFSEIEKLIQQGESVDDIAIACLDSQYHFFLEWFSYIYQIPLVIRKGKKLSEYPINQFFRNWSSAVSSQFEFKDFQKLFFDPLLPWKPHQKIKGQEVEVEVAPLLMEAFNNVNVASEVKQWKSELSRLSFKEKNSKEKEGLPLEWVADLFDDLQKELTSATNSSSFRSLKTNVESFLRERFDDSQREPQQRKAYQSALSKLGELASAEALILKNIGKKKLFNEDKYFDFWLQELEASLYVIQNLEAKISVYNEKVAAGAPIKNLFVIGISEESCRFTKKNFSFLTDFEREKVDYQQISNGELTEQFFRLYSATEGCQVRFSGSQSVCGSYRFVPALFSNDSLREEGRPTALRPDKIKEHITNEEFSRYSCLFPSEEHRQVLQNPLQQNITISPEVFNHFLKDKIYKNNFLAISTSSLEKMIECPFKWYLSRFNPTEIKTELDDIEANQVGTLVHQMVENYVREVMENIHKMESPDERKNAVLEFCHDFFRRMDSKEEDKIKIRDFVRPQEVVWNSLKSKMEDYLLYFSERNREIFGDCTKNLLEESFSRDLTLSGTEDVVTINGRIDRIMKNHGKYYILDYKTGKMPDKKKIYPIKEDEKEEEKPTKFQFAMYALLTENQNWGELAGAYYYGFKDNEKGFYYLFTDNERLQAAAQNPKKLKKLKGKDVVVDKTLLRERCLEALKNYKEIVESQRYLANKSDDSCQYCDYKAICRTHYNIKG